MARAGVTDQDIADDVQTPGDILTVGMGRSGQRFSPLKIIDAGNVAKLVPAWTFSFGKEKLRSQETQPLVYQGRMFITGSYSRLWALDARTGALLWAYERPLPNGILPCCDVVNRGAALYGDLVIFGTLDAHLMAFEQATGKLVWDQTLDDYQAGYTYTAAPLIVDGKVITGIAGSEFGVVGHVDARDAATGRLIWTRPTVEGLAGRREGKADGVTGTLHASWPGETYKTGGGAPWLGCTYAADVRLLYCGTGNPAPWNAYVRPGDNLYTASTLAIDPDTGRIVWSYQTTPHDQWDYDGVNEFIPFDLAKDGKVEKLGAKADRNGFFYVLDRSNGQFVRATPFVKTITWARGIDPVSGRPIEAPGNRPQDPESRGWFEKGEVTVAPGFLGAKNWMPMAFNPGTGLFYVPSNEWSMMLTAEKAQYTKGKDYIGARRGMRRGADDYVGALRAIDPATGAIVWEYRDKGPMWSGVLTTAANLVFAGTPEGEFKVFDAVSGRELWKFQTGVGVVGQPATWEMDGEQYVAVAVGTGGGPWTFAPFSLSHIQDMPHEGALWVFHLPGAPASSAPPRKNQAHTR